MSTSLLTDYLSPEVEDGERFEKMPRGNKEVMPVHRSGSALRARRRAPSLRRGGRKRADFDGKHRRRLRQF